MYSSYDTREEIVVSEGITRKILSYGRTMMSVEMSFDDSKKLDCHKHIHEQISYILEGKFEVAVEDEVFICTKGDVVYIPSNLLHQVSCIKKGKILDTYSPIREDFLV